jgi:outer membrane immunogenic protein
MRRNKKMRSIALACALLLGITTAAMAQATSGVSRSGDVALTYHWVHTNAPPGGGCGCFALNGGGISGSWDFSPQLAVVAEVSLDHTSNALSSKESLTLTSYLAGARFRLPDPWMHGPHALSPFAQLLVGGAHAGGGVAGVADGTSAFAGRLGGGVDLPVNPLITVRIQGDYYLTDFDNSADNHQNNVLVGAGVVIHWAR